MNFCLASTARVRPIWLGAVALVMAAGAAAIGYAAGSSQPHVVLSHALANAPGKTLTAVVVDYPHAKLLAVLVADTGATLTTYDE